MKRHAASLLALVTVTLLAACGSQPTPLAPTAVNPIGLAPTATLAPTLPAAVATDLAVPTQMIDTPMPPTLAPTATATPLPLNPLQIEYLRQREFPGSDITIEKTLAPGVNYKQYIASYQSDGLKIYALLTVPNGSKPKTGWPVVIFNHGFIPPAQYRTTERYVNYVATFARSGYIVFKSDYRGHGSSEGDATGGYGSPDYTIDVLNALASIKKYPDADPNRIGMWGHSMGGQVTLRSMVVSKDIKAGVIWSGVVGSYSNLIYNWHRNPAGTPFPPHATGGFPSSVYGRRWRQDLIDTYGTPESNPQFWASISPNSYVSDLSGPLQLQHDVADSEVPLKFSQELYDELKQAGKTTELYTYPGDDHNIAQNFNLAMQRSLAFFDKYVKSAGK